MNLTTKPSTPFALRAAKYAMARGVKTQKEMRKYLIASCLVLGISCKEETKILQGNKGGRRIEYSLTNNKMNGFYLEYDSLGMVKYFSQTKDGFFHGNYICYYENGTIMTSGTTIKGKQNGIKFSYYSNGILMSMVKYRMDSLIGEAYYYASNGLLSMAIDYRLNDGFVANYDTIKGGLISASVIAYDYLQGNESAHVKDKILFPKIPNCNVTVYLNSDVDEKKIEYVNPTDIEINFRKEVFITYIIEDKFGTKISRVAKLVKTGK